MSKENKLEVKYIIVNNDGSEKEQQQIADLFEKGWGVLLAYTTESAVHWIMQTVSDEQRARERANQN